MGTLSSYRMEAEQKGGPRIRPSRISLSSLRSTISGFCNADCRFNEKGGGGHDVSLENVNENHEQNLLKVPE